MSSIVSISNLNKTYEGGYQALQNVDLEIRKGEIFALLGPNGAGKTTLINSICGIVNPTSGKILVDGHDVLEDFRVTRSLIGLVPQELTTDAFESVLTTVNFSRGVFGKPRDAAYVEKIIRQLSLWDKKDNRIRTLSGGMKRRVMIAKALSHEPQVLFLDEPTAGVDVSLRRDMWDQVRELQKMGVTIILTTHYIEEAEEMADRVGIILNGKIIVTDEKKELMKKLGRKKMIIDLKAPLEQIPASLEKWNLSLSEDGMKLTYKYDSNKEDNGIAELLTGLCGEDIHYRDIHTDASSLEDIFIKLVNES